MQKRERDTSYPSYKIVIIYILETLKIFHHLSNKYRALSGLVKKKKNLFRIKINVSTMPKDFTTDIISMFKRINASKYKSRSSQEGRKKKKEISIKIYIR